MNGRVRIPNQVDEVKVMLLTLAHAGEPSHRKSARTAPILREQYAWRPFSWTAKKFLSKCSLRLLSGSGSYVPRLLASMLHTSIPNEVLHFDYLFFRARKDPLKYVPALIDDFSGTVGFYPPPLPLLSMRQSGLRDGMAHLLYLLLGFLVEAHTLLTKSSVTWRQDLTSIRSQPSNSHRG